MEMFYKAQIKPIFVEYLGFFVALPYTNGNNESIQCQDNFLSVFEIFCVEEIHATHFVFFSPTRGEIET